MGIIYNVCEFNFRNSCNLITFYFKIIFKAISQIETRKNSLKIEQVPEFSE